MLEKFLDWLLAFLVWALLLLSCPGWYPSLLHASLFLGHCLLIFQSFAIETPVEGGRIIHWPAGSAICTLCLALWSCCQLFDSVPFSHPPRFWRLAPGSEKNNTNQLTCPSSLPIQDSRLHLNNLPPHPPIDVSFASEQDTVQACFENVPLHTTMSHRLHGFWHTKNSEIHWLDKTAISLASWVSC